MGISRICSTSRRRIIILKSVFTKVKLAKFDIHSVYSSFDMNGVFFPSSSAV